MSTYGADRIANLGAGSVYQCHVGTEDTIESLLPDGFDVTLHLQNGTKGKDNFDKMVCANKGDIHFTLNETNNRIFITGYSTLADRFSDILDLTRGIVTKANPLPDAPSDSVFAGFWRMTGNGPAVTTRKLVVPEWDEISKNYATTARTELTRLHEMTSGPSEQAGNIILLHGPPGTGKTTALRSLARAWKPWADIHYIIDPDQFLGLADYMWQAVLSMDDSPSPTAAPTPRYKMLIMEDTDELISARGKEQVGQAFSRLLNLGDGFLGQSQNLVIVLTTNVNIAEFAPAITRPGRCLANIEVPKMGRVDSVKWLQSQGSVDAVKTLANQQEATLAELFQLQAEEDQIVAKTDVAVPGQYL